MLKKKILEALREVHKIQGWDGNWNSDSYMHGMYNGMEMMLSLVEEREPDFREAPKEWLIDRMMDEKPIAVNEQK